MPYTGHAFTDLVETEPNGDSEPVANLDDAVCQIKRYLKQTLGDPATSGTIFDAIEAEGLKQKLPIGSIIPYADSGTWSSPSSFLKCNGLTIGNVGSGADYESVEYETLFNILKKGYNNAGTETWSAENDPTHRVKLPNLPAFAFGQEDEITVDATGGNETDEDVINIWDTDLGDTTFKLDFDALSFDAPIDVITSYKVGVSAKKDGDDPAVTSAAPTFFLSLDEEIYNVRTALASFSLNTGTEYLSTPEYQFTLPMFGSFEKLIMVFPTVISGVPNRAVSTVKVSIVSATGYVKKYANFIIKAN
jgi:hypothetical protein